MHIRLQEVVACLGELIQHHSEPRLLELLAGLQTALTATRPEYTELCQAAQWLADPADVLDPDEKPARTGAQVQAEWQTCLTDIETQGQGSPRLQEFGAKIRKVSLSYAPAYSIPMTCLTYPEPTITVKVSSANCAAACHLPAGKPVQPNASCYAKVPGN